MSTNFKRKRTDTDVTETSSKKTRASTISHSAEHCNMLDDISARKRRAVDDGQMTSKRMRCSNLSNRSQSCDVSLEDVRIQRGKRKASDDAERSQNNKRCLDETNTNKPGMISEEESSVQTEKRKTSGDGGSENNKRSSHSSSSTESSTTESSSCKDNTDTGLVFNNVSPEEEKIYEMSSSGNTSKMDFTKKYIQLGRIGTGGFGSVFSGYRKADRLPVAIKHIHRTDIMYERVVCNGNVYNVILEVALMLKTTGLTDSVGQSAAVHLLDWYIFEHVLILVMERPVFCEDLYKYVQTNRGSLGEREAKTILRQLVDAAIDMHSKGVFHRDIKPRNVLVDLSSRGPRVRVIDFGCGAFSTEYSYDSFMGTLAFSPPEWFDYRTYWARPTTVWQLGVLFYSLLHAHEHFQTIDFINNRMQISQELSTDCKNLLNMCLARDPAERATLKELQQCPALKETSN